MTDTPHWLWRAAKYRARLNSLPFTITLDDVKVSTHCPVLGIPLGNYIHESLTLSEQSD